MTIYGEKKHKVMDENLYWEIVNASTRYIPETAKQLSFLVKDLKARPLDDIVGFMLRTYQLQQNLYTSQVWCACCLMNKGNCLENHFENFRSWIISSGKDTYYKAIANPDSLAGSINPQIELYDFEEFGHASSYAFVNKTGGKDIYSYMGPNFSFPKKPDIGFNWNPEAPNTMKAICPDLFEKMWGKNKYNPAARHIHLLRPKKGNSGWYRRKSK